MSQLSKEWKGDTVSIVSFLFYLLELICCSSTPQKLPETENTEKASFLLC